MALKEWNLTENFNLEELNDNFSFLDEKIETTNSNLVDTNEELTLKASQSDLSNLITTVANHSTYSTTEEVVIGTYDGKPLYRKAVAISALKNSAGSTTYAHGISNVEVIMLGKNSNAKNGVILPLPHVYPPSLTGCIGLNVDATNVIVLTGGNFSTYSATIWLEYTKTTD